MRHAAAFCIAFALALPWSARAQAPAEPGPSSSPGAPRVEFFSAFQMRLGALRFGVSDEQFAWEGRFAGDVDLVDFGSGRLNFAAEYDVVLGTERRAFDPTQGYYVLDLRLTRRFQNQEVGAVFHHVSRHLSDRSKPQAVDWNLVGAEYRRRSVFGAVRVEGLLHAGGMVKTLFVDYAWQTGGRLRVEREANRRATLIAQGSVDVLGVDESVAGRRRQVAAYGEGGVRLAGRAAAVELFAAVERRVDPDPLLRGTRAWPLFGFRFVNR